MRSLLAWHWAAVLLLLAGASVSLSNGIQVQGAVLMGADGARSEIAKHLNLAAPNYAGYSAYRYVLFNYLWRPTASSIPLPWYRAYTVAQWTLVLSKLWDFASLLIYRDKEALVLLHSKFLVSNDLACRCKLCILVQDTWKVTWIALSCQWKDDENWMNEFEVFHISFWLMILKLECGRL